MSVLVEPMTLKARADQPKRKVWLPCDTLLPFACFVHDKGLVPPASSPSPSSCGHVFHQFLTYTGTKAISMSFRVTDPAVVAGLDMSTATLRACVGSQAPVAMQPLKSKNPDSFDASAALSTDGCRQKFAWALHDNAYRMKKPPEEANWSPIIRIELVVGSKVLGSCQLVAMRDAKVLHNSSGLQRLLIVKQGHYTLVDATTIHPGPSNDGSSVLFDLYSKLHKRIVGMAVTPDARGRLPALQSLLKDSEVAPWFTGWDPKTALEPVVAEWAKDHVGSRLGWFMLETADGDLVGLSGIHPSRRPDGTVVNTVRCFFRPEYRGANVAVAAVSRMMYFALRRGLLHTLTPDSPIARVEAPVHTANVRGQAFVRKHFGAASCRQDETDGDGDGDSGKVTTWVWYVDTLSFLTQSTPDAAGGRSFGGAAAGSPAVGRSGGPSAVTPLSGCPVRTSARRAAAAAKTAVNNPDDDGDDGDDGDGGRARAPPRRRRRPAAKKAPASRGAGAGAGAGAGSPTRSDGGHGRRGVQVHRGSRDEDDEDDDDSESEGELSLLDTLAIDKCPVVGALLAAVDEVEKRDAASRGMPYGYGGGAGLPETKAGVGGSGPPGGVLKCPVTGAVLQSSSMPPPPSSGPLYSLKREGGGPAVGERPLCRRRVTTTEGVE